MTTFLFDVRFGAQQAKGFQPRSRQIRFVLFLGRIKHFPICSEIPHLSLPRFPIMACKGRSEQATLGNLGSDRFGIGVRFDGLPVYFGPKKVQVQKKWHENSVWARRYPSQRVPRRRGWTATESCRVVCLLQTRLYQG